MLKHLQLNSRLAKIFFPAEQKRKKMQLKRERELGQDPTAIYEPTYAGKRRSMMYNNPFPWIKNGAKLGLESFQIIFDFF